MDGERCAGAVGFSVRENKFYVFKSKATLVAMGGAVHVFKPRSSRRRHGARLVSTMELRLFGLLHPEGRRGNDLPGSALHPGALQGCVRSGGRVVPAVQIAGHQLAGRQLHDRAQARAGKVGALRPRQAGSGQPAQLPGHAGRDGRQRPDPHADRGSHPEDRREVQGRSQGLQEEDEGTRIARLGKTSSI